MRHPQFGSKTKHKNMDYFIGLDVSLASTAICVLNAHGKVVKEIKVETEPEALAAFLRSLSANVIVIGLEAGPMSQWLHKHLMEGGFEIVLMETRQVKGALQAMPIKTDRRDAEGIAGLLQMGWFRPVHCKSVSAREMRALQSTINLELFLRGVLSMPGVGAIIALTVRSAIDDPERLRSSKDVGPWAGLTPRRNRRGSNRRAEPQDAYLEPSPGRTRRAYQA